MLYQTDSSSSPKRISSFNLNCMVMPLRGVPPQRMGNKLWDLEPRNFNLEGKYGFVVIIFAFKWPFGEYTSEYLIFRPIYIYISIYIYILTPLVGRCLSLTFRLKTTRPRAAAPFGGAPARSRLGPVLGCVNIHVMATSGLQGAWSILHHRLVTSPRFSPSHSHSRFELAPEMMGFTRRATTTANLNHVLDQHWSQKTKDATLFVND